MRGSHHPGRPAVQRRGHPLPASATQRNAFDGASAIRERLRRNGFTDVRSQTMPGWQRDIVHTFTATAPTMTDPRRAEHPAPPGAPSAATTGRRPHVVVVGAGIAGLAAAAGSPSAASASMSSKESHYLGGRVGGWTDTSARRYRRWR